MARGPVKIRICPPPPREGRGALHLFPGARRTIEVLSGFFFLILFLVPPGSPPPLRGRYPGTWVDGSGPDPTPPHVLKRSVGPLRAAGVPAGQVPDPPLHRCPAPPRWDVVTVSGRIWEVVTGSVPDRSCQFKLRTRSPTFGHSCNVIPTPHILFLTTIIKQRTFSLGGLLHKRKFQF